MAFTFIACVGGNDDASGTTLDCSATLNVAAGDLLIAHCEHDGTTTTFAVAKDSGSPANAFTFDAVNQIEASFNDLEIAQGYVLSAAADATATFRLTVGAARTFRRVLVLQFRPSAGDTVTKDGDGNKAQGNSTAPNSGNFSTTGTDEVVVGGYGDYSAQNTSSEQINSVAAIEPTGSPQSFTSVWYRILTATFTGGAASATLGGAGDWLCGGIAFKATGGAAAPNVPVPMPPTCFFGTL